MSIAKALIKTISGIRFLSFSGLIFLLLLIPGHVSAADEVAWYDHNANGESIVHLYFFWSKKCPHCLEAKPDIMAMDNEFPWLKLHSLELSEHPENIQAYTDMAKLFSKTASSVPAFMFCRNLLTGYEDKATTGDFLRSALQSCYQFSKQTKPDNSTAFVLNQVQQPSIELPLLGNLKLSQYSLPVLTIFIAGMDAFNPCAFFVLLFLLSMMVHTRSRARMALIGGIFVFFSGAVYFVFMAAWLNVFIYLGELRLMTLVAGTIAVLIALVNIKDFFYFKKGFSLTISAQEKPKLIDRMRALLRLDSIITVIFSTIVLALVANSYELLCTAGFPMVYTRILTLNALSPESYYLYLLLYNLIYILPLLTIVILFTIKLGSRKLSEQEGMILKLLSGVMMLMLGLLLVAAPQLLNNVMVAALLLLTAITVTWGLVKVSNRNPK